MPKHLKEGHESITKELKSFKKRKELKLDDLLKQDDFSGFKLTRRKVNREARICIETIINSINTKDDLEPDTAIRALRTLKSLYLLDVEVGEDKKGKLRVKRWFEIEG